ncbi:MAG: xanthine dehydrogenase family protein molybdopterin-binding subunit [Bacteroidetes bacterium]|nr:xanthine dehydrogenase family protein molybdopterin-binding subunit [Bacteroidota bacterium]
MSRRNFLKAAGSLTIGFCLGSKPGPEPGATDPGLATPSPTSSPIPNLPTGLPNPGPTDPPPESLINAWLEVLADGRIRVLTGKIELGQGISTAVAQVAAEELDMDISQVEVLIAETGRTPNEGYTAGSNSIESSAMSIRRAAAAARTTLLQLGARHLNTSIDNLTLSKGIIIPRNGGRGLTIYEALDGRQLTGTIPESLTLKPKNTYQLVGKPIPRNDLPRITKGEPVYVHDLSFPGMVHARIVRPPSYGGKLLQYDDQPVKKTLPDFIKTVVNGSWLAVIAAKEYPAIQAQRLLQKNSKWSDGPPLPGPGSTGQTLADYLRGLPAKTEEVTKKGQPFPDAAPAGPATPTHLRSRYSKPYIMHGAIGPSCAVALCDTDNHLHIWCHSQGVYPLRATIANLLHISEENIHIKGVPGSGCYGHNGADDVSADAALAAMAYPGKHVRVQWMREEEHAWEPYGSAMVMELAARLDPSGKISHWKYELWSDTHGARPSGNAANLLPGHYIEQPFPQRPSGFSGGAYRNAPPYYSIPNQYVAAHFFEGPLRTSSLRSLGAYANLFAIESFMDELAEAAGKDPFDFRMTHLDDPRAKAVLEQLRTLIKDIPGTGIAFSRYKNNGAYCAVAAQVTRDTPASHIRVQKMWAVIDAGEVINMDGITNQTEGGMVQSASWTMHEEVAFNSHGITSTNWAAYPIFNISQAPEVEVSVINRPSEPAMGAGEAAQGPAGAAIVNAVYRLTGQRVRHLPVNRATTTVTRTPKK